MKPNSFGALAVVLSVALTLRLGAANHPNVVLVITDDQRWDAMSCAGNPYLKTPNIDRLASEGARFKNAFCTTSLCSPSRASILSGLYAHAHGVVNNFTEFPTNLASFPKRLLEIGYQTAYIGKWHMGEDNDAPRPGFNYWASHKGQGKYYGTEFNVNGKMLGRTNEYYTHVVTGLALDFLKQMEVMNMNSFEPRGMSSGSLKPSWRPFCLIIGHKAPHSFYFPEPKYSNAFDSVQVEYPRTAFRLDDKPDWIKQRITTWHGIYGPLFEWRKEFPDSRPEAVKDFAAMTRAYWGTILSVDDSVGRLYDALRKMGQIDNTLFIFTTDNGLLNGEHGMVDKRTMHEPSIRVPLVVRYPPLLATNKSRIIEPQVLNVDIAPTIVDICGAKPLKNIHGQSWKPLLEGKTRGWRDGWFYEYNYEKQFPYTPNVRGIRTDDWKYIHYPHGDGAPDRHKAELYNLKEDPAETRNLIDEPRYAKKVKELQQQLTKLMKAAGALPDKMPLDEGIKSALPDQKIR
jgi:N-acetylglucosamine-6-sulfatase